MLFYGKTFPRKCHPAPEKTGFQIYFACFYKKCYTIFAKIFYHVPLFFGKTQKFIFSEMFFAAIRQPFSRPAKSFADRGDFILNAQKEVRTERGADFLFSDFTKKDTPVRANFCADGRSLINRRRDALNPPSFYTVGRFSSAAAVKLRRRSNPSAAPFSCDFYDLPSGIPKSYPTTNPLTLFNPFVTSCRLNPGFIGSFLFLYRSVIFSP